MASFPEVQRVDQGPGVKRKDHGFTFGPVEFVVAWRQSSTHIK